MTRHHLHRRAAHHRRRRRRRGRDRRVEHAEAGAGARRAAVHRRHDARRVPQVHREGRRARAPFPADHGRSAHHVEETVEIIFGLRDKYERTTASSRSPTRRSVRRFGFSDRYITIASCPTRRSTSSTRPARARRLGRLDPVRDHGPRAVHRADLEGEGSGHPGAGVREGREVPRQGEGLRAQSSSGEAASSWNERTARQGNVKTSRTSPRWCRR